MRDRISLSLQRARDLAQPLYEAAVSALEGALPERG
jgi:hypothetical protein